VSGARMRSAMARWRRLLVRRVASVNFLHEFNYRCFLLGFFYVELVPGTSEA
jgi:hypothetical protein